MKVVSAPILGFLLCSCTVVLEGGAIYPDLILSGRKEEVCVSLLSVDLAGSNPFLEEEARDLFLKALTSRTRKECTGTAGMRVRVRNLTAGFIPDTYGYPPRDAPQSIPSPATLRVELKGEFLIERCLPEAHPIALPFSEKGWVLYNADPYRNEESALLALRELAERVIRVLFLKIGEESCKSSFSPPAS